MRYLTHTPHQFFSSHSFFSNKFIEVLKFGDKEDGINPVSSFSDIEYSSLLKIILACDSNNNHVKDTALSIIEGIAGPAASPLVREQLITLYQNHQNSHGICIAIIYLLTKLKLQSEEYLNKATEIAGKCPNQLAKKLAFQIINNYSTHNKEQVSVISKALALSVGDVDPAVTKAASDTISLPHIFRHYSVFKKNMDSPKQASIINSKFDNQNAAIIETKKGFTLFSSGKSTDIQTTDISKVKKAISKARILPPLMLNKLVSG